MDVQLLLDPLQQGIAVPDLRRAPARDRPRRLCAAVDGGLFADQNQLVKLSLAGETGAHGRQPTVAGELYAPDDVVDEALTGDRRIGPVPGSDLGVLILELFQEPGRMSVLDEVQRSEEHTSALQSLMR